MKPIRFMWHYIKKVYKVIGFILLIIFTPYWLGRAYEFIINEMKYIDLLMNTEGDSTILAVILWSEGLFGLLLLALSIGLILSLIELTKQIIGAYKNFR